jgi:hypothetical protein
MFPLVGFAVGVFKTVIVAEELANETGVPRITLSTDVPFADTVSVLGQAIGLVTVWLPSFGQRESTIV